MEPALVLTILTALVAVCLIGLYQTIINYLVPIVEAEPVSLGEDWESVDWKSNWANFQRATDPTDYAASFVRETDIYHGGAAGCSAAVGQSLYPKKGTLSAIPANISLWVYLDTLDYGTVGVWFGCQRDGDGDLVDGAVAYKRVDNTELKVQHMDANGAPTGGGASNGATRTENAWHKIVMSFAANESNWDITSAWYNAAETLIDSCVHTFTPAELPTLDYGMHKYEAGATKNIRFDDFEVVP
jgi:hypothetical protein